MGIYYIVVNDLKEEYLDPIYFGDSIKFVGVFKGLHGQGVAELLVQTENPEQYKRGYWARDTIRVLGDNFEDEHKGILENYNNISFYVLANVFEKSSKEVQAQILERVSQKRDWLAELFRVNREYRYASLNHSLKQLEAISKLKNKSKID